MDNKKLLPKVVTMKKPLLCFTLLSSLFLGGLVTAQIYQIGPVRIFSGENDVFITVQEIQLEAMQCPEASCPPETAGLWWDVYYFDGSHLFFFNHYFKRPYFFYDGSWVFLNYTSDSLIFYRLNPNLKCIKELGKIGINYTEEIYFDFPLLYIRRNGKVEKYLIGRDKIKSLYEDFGSSKQEAKSVTITLDKKFIHVSNGTNSYMVPMQDIEQYLAFEEDVAYLKAVFLKDGVLFYYPAKVHADENRTQIKRSLREIPLFFYNGDKLEVFSCPMLTKLSHLKHVLYQPKP